MDPCSNKKHTIINYICYNENNNNLNYKVKVLSPLIITLSIVMDMVHSLYELLEMLGLTILLKKNINLLE